MTPFRTTRRVEFRDTDAAGIMHFSVFFVAMEEAEHALLRHLGLSVHQPADSHIVSWPRVAADCQYRSAARFEEILTIDVRVERLGEKSVTYAFRFSCDERLIAEGKITTVCCELRAGEKPLPIPIPAEIREKLEKFA
jgi:acyl-CoA thioester hydrolase